MKTDGAANARTKIKLTDAERDVLLETAEEPFNSHEFSDDEDDDDINCAEETLATLDIFRKSGESDSIFGQSSDLLN